MRRHLVALAAIACLAPRAHAQMIVNGSLLVGTADHRVDAGYGVERAAGAVYGAAASVRLWSRLELEVETQSGTLSSKTEGAMDRDMAEVDGRVAALVAPWLALRVDVTRRSYATDVARQTWTVVGTGVEARLSLLKGAARGILRASWLPVVSVSGLSGPDGAFSVASGLEYNHGRWRVAALYSLERYDFPVTGSAPRPEQLTALWLRGAYRVLPR